MDIKILNTSYQVVGLIDITNSFRWTERFNEPGEFEIYTPVTRELLTILQLDYYVQIPDSEYTMIIESREIKTDPEQGNMLVVSGRSVESILDRRLVYIQTTLASLDLELCFKRIIKDAFVDGIPLTTVRNIPNFVFVETFNTYIKSIVITAQYQALDGDILNCFVMPLTKKYSIGFKLTLTTANNFEFRLYLGTDRSYAQTTNSYVVFSPSFDNLINSNYFESKKLFKSMSLIIGDETVGTSLYRIEAWSPYATTSESHLTRREAVTDASNLSRLIEGTSTPISDAEYYDKLVTRGTEDMAANYPFVRQFDANINVLNSFKYRKDFFIGDIVQIENEYGIKGTAQIIEMTYSENPGGFNWVPTLDYL